MKQSAAEHQRATERKRRYRALQKAGGAVLRVPVGNLNAVTEMSAFVVAIGSKADMTLCGCLLFRSLLGAKRTYPVALHMSANDPKRTCPVNGSALLTQLELVSCQNSEWPWGASAMKRNVSSGVVAPVAAANILLRTKRKSATALAVLISFITVPEPSIAAPLTWYLNNVNFTDGGTATGSFILSLISYLLIGVFLSVAETLPYGPP